MTTFNMRAPPNVSFDIDAFLASLPPPGRCIREDHHEDDYKHARGSAGQRLRPAITTKVPDELLREIAVDALGAVRCSQKYLAALRIVLGNQAHAERFGYLLELNTRTTFTTDKVMRTILGQMQAAGVTFKKQVALGLGRVQAMHCYRRNTRRTHPADQLNYLCRQTEGVDHGLVTPVAVAAEYVPY